MKRIVLDGLVAGLVVVAAGCDAPRSENLEIRTGAISGGQVETGFPAVGCLTGVGICTGTLIAPNLVLSAKHCGAMTTFGLGNTCGAPSTSRTIDFSIPYHGGESAIPFTSPPMFPHDLIIYHLQTPIYNVRPLQINPGGYPPNGASCVAVGFGNDSMGNAGTKRSGTVTVEGSGQLGVTVGGVGAIGMYSHIRVSQGTGLPQPGDSGGPLLCNGNGVIRGVLSGHFSTPIGGEYYVGIESTQTWDSAWVTSVASNYVNEPMIAVTSWSTSRFDLFARGTDGGVYTKAWNNGTWLPSTFGWGSLGGFITGTPEAVSWGNNRIDVFVRGGDSNPQTDAFSSTRLLHLFWNGSSWTWEDMGGAGVPFHPVAVSWGANRWDVFAVNSIGLISHWYGSNLTTAFETVPSENGPATFLGPMKAISTSSGNLDLYAVGADRVLYHSHFDSSNMWTDWDNLGGQTHGTPAVTTRGGGIQDIFVKGTDTNLYQKTYAGGIWYPSQAGFYSLGGPIDGPPAATSMQSNWLTLVSNAPNNADTFKHAYKGWFNGSQWSPSDTTWSDLGGIANGAVTLQGIPNIGANLFDVGGSYTPGITSRTLTTNWGGSGSLGGVVSW